MHNVCGRGPTAGHLTTGPTAHNEGSGPLASAGGGAWRQAVAASGMGFTWASSSSSTQACMDAPAGHFFERAAHVLTAASRRGFAPLLATSRPCPADIGQPLPIPVVPTCSHDANGVFRGSHGMAEVTLAEHVRAFTAETSDLLALIGAAPGDVCLISTACGTDVLALINLAEESALIRRLSWHLVFREPVVAPMAQDPAVLRSWRTATHRLRSDPRTANVRLCTDNEMLTEDVSRLLGGLPLGTIPYPVNADLRPRRARRPAGAPLCVIYAGDARAEKVYSVPPYVAHGLWSRYVETGRVQLVIQSNFTERSEPDVQMARWHLAQMAGPGLRLLTAPMDSNAYRDFIGARQTAAP